MDIRSAERLCSSCYLPWQKREIPALTLRAECSHEVIRNGTDRGDENLWVGQAGDVLEYRFGEATDISRIRLVFDSDLNRSYHNMPCSYPLVQTKFKLPKTLIKRYRIEGEMEDGTTLSITVEDNRRRFAVHNVNWHVRSLRLIPLEAYGTDQLRIFDFEVQ